MDPRLLEYYKRELVHVRDMGGEFARDFPKIAGRLGLEGFDCADPYVERLLEGFAFLAARVQHKIDSEFPRFTQHLLESVFPNYLSPTPSMAVVEFHPDMSEGSLAEGYLVPRDTVLRGQLGKGEQTPCEYRTAHDVTLWPLEIRGAEYYPDARNLPRLDLAGFEGIRAGIRVRLGTTGLGFDKLALTRLVLFLRGSDELPWHVHEQLLANLEGILVCPDTQDWQERLDASCLRRVGFDEEQALLPRGARSFEGYRLLGEYLAFPERFLQVELSGLERAVRRWNGTELDLFFLLNRKDPVLENTLAASHFALFCAPAINLFPRRADRIHLSDQQHEYHVVPDRTRPLDFEVHSVTGVTGHGTSAEEEREFLPFYATRDLAPSAGDGAFYALRRVPRVESSSRRAKGARSSIAGSEVFLSLVDGAEAPYPSGLRQLEVQALCTNRDLPLILPVGQGRTDFTIESGAPVAEVRCVAGPTRPRPSRAEGRTAWRLVSHLSLNYLSLMDNGESQGALALRELLSLYGDTSEAHIRKQIEQGLKSVRSRPVTRKMSSQGPIAFGRGLEITVTCDESAFEGTGVLLLSAVLDEFFARYVSINSFTETVLRTLDRGEVVRWPARTGRRHVL